MSPYYRLECYSCLCLSLPMELACPRNMYHLSSSRYSTFSTDESKKTCCPIAPMTLLDTLVGVPSPSA